MIAEAPTNLQLPYGSHRLNGLLQLFLAHALSNLLRWPCIRPPPPHRMLLQREEPADKAGRPALKKGWRERGA